MMLQYRAQALADIDAIYRFIEERNPSGAKRAHHFGCAENGQRWARRGGAPLPTLRTGARLLPLTGVPREANRGLNPVRVL
jgi:hypothetical protein